MCNEKMNQAVRDCLDSCYASETPFAALATFGEQLSKRMDWTADDVAEVTLRAVRVLSHVAQNDGAPEHLELDAASFERPVG
jgi:hypothetical protein